MKMKFKDGDKGYCCIQNNLYPHRLFIKKGLIRISPDDNSTVFDEKEFCHTKNEAIDKMIKQLNTFRDIE